MAVEVEEAARSADHEHRTYYFCSDGCRQRFLEDPPHYLAGAGRE
jgi:Cu+-exporting ATPase